MEIEFHATIYRVKFSSDEARNIWGKNREVSESGLISDLGAAIRSVPGVISFDDFMFSSLNYFEFGTTRFALDAPALVAIEVEKHQAWCELMNRERVLAQMRLRIGRHYQKQETRMTTQYQRHNLVALATVLEDLPKHKREEHFGMEAWAQFTGATEGDDDYLSVLSNELVRDIIAGAKFVPCGTSACAAGWGVVSGIGIHKRVKNEDIFEYVARVFSGDYKTETWLFAGSWNKVDNTALGAAARIRYFLDIGLPPNYHPPNYHPLVFYQNDEAVKKYRESITPFLVKPIEERAPA